MITTTLNSMRQTQHLKISTQAYDAGELDVLLAETATDQRRNVRGTQRLSPELLAQILAGDFDPAKPDGGRDGNNKGFTA